jgi:carbon storage regulator
MLVLTRKPGEGIVIGQSVVVTFIHVEKGKIRLGIEAPAEVRVLRQELAQLPAGRGRLLRKK